jgi:hypothetical protein
MDRMRCQISLATALVALIGVALPAQGPMSGTTWGAELAAGVGPTTAWLLKFRSPDVAWTLGLAADLQNSTSTITGVAGAPPENSATSGAFFVSVGYRGYRQLGSALRPFTEFGAQTTYNAVYGDNISSVHIWSLGPYLALGASYFFNPHVSLGASGTLGAAYARSTTSIGGGGRLRTSSFGVAANAVRLLGAVYF